jgi:hypothetical protein
LSLFQTDVALAQKALGVFAENAFQLFVGQELG